ncbi:MAG: 2-C-methyl-D-erythritol 2,4-cyclodiphosphate synthase [Candidatus Omnitrophica bacterium]|nr:2-C-methyl-D-erythritol 2,4-cyclodiphosphate synthase [Candidatus Omnitrophota bacterium]
MRTGLGFDIHRFEEGKILVLAGIQIPYHCGLKGHSDGDVVLHSISDAISGALGIEDIGTRFPDTDMSLKGIKSSKILESYRDSLISVDARIYNLDIVIIAEKPKLQPWYGAMKKSIAQILGVNVSCVGVKAKTMEGLGEIGKGKAIACFASILIDIP